MHASYGLWTIMDFSMYENANVLLTGCSGFVGRYVTARLLEIGSIVFGLDRWKAIAASILPDLTPDLQERFRPMSGNLRDISSLANAMAESNPDYVIHLAAQSYVPESFGNPIDTLHTNFMGTCNLLEAIRHSDSNARIVFAGSSEEYGLVLFSKEQFERVLKKYGHIFPEPSHLPEVPITENNPLRPMSPYAVSKVAGDYIMRNYFHTYGLKTVVSRAFNHEGAGRGAHFVTALVARQVMQLKHGERDKLVIGNVSAFRDWSHVSDIVDGYLLLAQKGKSGEVYNQGSERTNSVLSFILLALEQAGFEVKSLSTILGDVKVKDPISFSKSNHFGLTFQTTRVDRMILNEELQFSIEQKGLAIDTSEGTIHVDFNPERFRPSEVPILLSSTKKIQSLGFKTSRSLPYIINDQLNYYLDANRRRVQE